MKKLILFTLTTLLLLFNCSNGANEPCKDENCITDEQLNFFKMHLEDDTLTKKVLFEMSSMDLSSKGITSLDTGIFNNLTNLTSVDLTGNPICIVDKADVGLADGLNLTFDGWNCLTDEQVTFFNGHIMSITTKQELYDATELDLSSNSISSLPSGIFNNLTNLRDLRLYDNDLTSIPAEIGNLNSLTILLLYSNNLASIPDGIFTKLTNLTTLSLFGNKLTSIPAEIGNLNSLTSLYLSHNDLDLTSIPAGLFTNLTSLTSLELKFNSDTNTFTCNDTNYSTWGLDTTLLSTSFVCL